MRNQLFENVAEWQPQGELSAFVKTYTAFVQNVATYVTDREAYSSLLHPDVTFFEMPNLVNKQGQVRTTTAGFDAIAKGKQLLASQRYTFLSFFEKDDTLVAEMIWRGTLAIDAGPLKKDSELKARICVIVQFKDDKIYRVHNYDCYAPFV